MTARYFAAPDGDDTPTIWRQEDDAQSRMVVRLTDLAEPDRDESWNRIVAALTTTVSQLPFYAARNAPRDLGMAPL